MAIDATLVKAPEMYVNVETMVTSPVVKPWPIVVERLSAMFYTETSLRSRGSTKFHRMQRSVPK